MRAWLKAQRIRLWQLAKGIALAVFLLALTFLLRDYLSYSVESPPLLILFVLPIVLSAYFFGFAAGLLATTLAALGAGFFLRIPADFLVNQDRPADWILFLLFCASGVVIAIVVGALRTTKRALQESEARLVFALEASGLGAWELGLTSRRVFRTPTHDRIFWLRPIAAAVDL